MPQEPQKLLYGFQVGDSTSYAEFLRVTSVLRALDIAHARHTSVRQPDARTRLAGQPLQRGAVDHAGGSQGMRDPRPHLSSIPGENLQDPAVGLSGIDTDRAGRGQAQDHLDVRERPRHPRNLDDCPATTEVSPRVI